MFVNMFNVFQLQAKYPYMYKILQSTPPEELVNKVYRDRHLTTYQVDYCRQGEYIITVVIVMSFRLCHYDTFSSIF